MQLNELAYRIHQSSIRRGFYDPEKVRPFDGQLMNIVTEVAEAQEEWRNGRDPTETYWTIVPGPAGEGLADDMFRMLDGRMQIHNYESYFSGYDPKDDGPVWLDLTPELVRKLPNAIPLLKPEGIPAEFADIIIRVLDICGQLGIDIDGAVQDKLAFNDTRPYRHGNKRS